MNNKLREQLRLSAIEVKRIVWRKQFLLVVVVAFLFSCNDLFNWRPRGDPTGFYGLGATSDFSNELNTLLAGIASADALAVDTEVGFVGLVLARKIRRRDYILHKAMAIFAVASLVGVIRYAFLMAMGAIVLPWATPGLGHCLVDVTDRLGGIHCVIPEPNTLKEAMGPFPALFLTHPFLNDFVLVIAVALGTGVLALLGLLVAACGGNGYLAIAAPFVLAFGIHNAVPNLPWVNPLNLLDIRFGYFHMLPGLEYRIGVWFLLWLAWVVGLIGLSMLIAEKRELAQKVHGT
jgi:hypothetical protein